MSTVVGQMERGPDTFNSRVSVDNLTFLDEIHDRFPLFLVNDLSLFGWDAQR